jgi:hypothetical protein
VDLWNSNLTQTSAPWRRLVVVTRRVALLSPVEKLKEPCLEEFGEYKLKEYRLKKETESLKAFVDLFFLANDEREINCMIMPLFVYLVPIIYVFLECIETNG